MIQKIVARIRGLFAWWMQDIRGRKSLVGKAASLGIGLFAICCVCSVGLGAVRSAGQAVGIVPTNTATPVATATTAPTNTPVPTLSPIPTNTLEPTAAPSPNPTLAPTEAPVPTQVALPPTVEPTAKPAIAVQPTTAPKPTAKPANAPIPTAVDVGAYPCKPGQIKGNRNSGIYHAPGQRDYGKTQSNVQCFDTEADAQAAGYRKAKR